MKTTTKYSWSLLALTAAMLAGCGGETPAPAETATAPAATAPAVAAAPSRSLQNTNPASCVAEQGVEYVCGIINGEDILRLSTPWLLVSGMNGELGADASINGKIHLVNPIERSWEVLFPGAAPVLEHDTEMFAGCPGPLD